MGSFLNDPAQEETIVPEAPPVVAPTVGGSFLYAKVDDESLQQASIAPIGGSFLTVDPTNPLPVGSGEGPQAVQDSLFSLASQEEEEKKRYGVNPLKSLYVGLLDFVGKRNLGRAIGAAETAPENPPTSYQDLGQYYEQKFGQIPPQSGPLALPVSQAEHDEPRLRREELMAQSEKLSSLAPQSWRDEIKELQQTPLEWRTAPGKILSSFFENLPLMADNIVEGTAGSTAGSLVGMPKAGAVAASINSMAAVEAAGFYTQARQQMEDAGADPDIADDLANRYASQYGVVAGAVESASDLAQLKWLKDIFKSGGKQVTEEAIKELAKTSYWEPVKLLLKGGASEGGEEWTQTSLQNKYMRDMAKELKQQTGIEWTPQEESAKEAGIVAAGVGVLTAGMGSVKQGYDIHKARNPEASEVVPYAPQEELLARRNQVDDFFVAVQQAAPHIPTEQLEAEKQIFYRVMDNLPEGTDTSRFLDVNNLKASVGNQEVGDAAEGVLEQNAIKALGMDNISDMSIPGTLSEHLLTAMGSKSVPKDLASMTVGEFMEFAPKVEAVAYLGAPERKAEAREVLTRLSLWDEKSESLKDNWDAPIVLNLRNKLLEMPDVQAALGEDVVLGEDGKPVLVFHGTGQGGTDNIFTIDGLKKLQEGAAAEDVALLNKVLDPVVAEGKTIASVVTKLPVAEQDRIHELAEAAKEKTGFERFAPSSKGIFFASSPSTGGAFSTTRVGPRRIAPVFLKGKLFDFRNPEHIAELQKETFVGEAALQSIKKGSWESIQRSNIQDAIKRLGFTGFVERENSSINYSVFSPDQVVPAFDPLRKGKGLFQGESKGKVPDGFLEKFLEDVRTTPNMEALSGASASEQARARFAKFKEVLPQFDVPELFDFVSRMHALGMPQSYTRAFFTSRPEYAQALADRLSKLPPDLASLPEDIKFRFAVLGESPLAILAKSIAGQENHLDGVLTPKQAHQVLLEIGKEYHSVLPDSSLRRDTVGTLRGFANNAWERMHPKSPELSDIAAIRTQNQEVAKWIINHVDDPQWNEFSHVPGEMQEIGGQYKNRLDEISPADLTQGIKTNIRTAFRNSAARAAAAEAAKNKAEQETLDRPIPPPNVPKLAGVTFLDTVRKVREHGQKNGLCLKDPSYYPAEKLHSGESYIFVLKTKDGESTLELKTTKVNTFGETPNGPGIIKSRQELVEAQHRSKFNGSPSISNLNLAQEFMQKIALGEAKELFQNASERGVKGSVQFQNRQAFFNFLSGSDISTVIHEGAHWFFMFLRDEQLSIIAKWAKVDLAILQKAVADPTKLTADEWTHFRAAQEKFANGWEKWRRANRPPISALEEVFQKFKEWLTNIYTSLAGEPRFKNLNITPEVQKLFEDMIVSENERKQEYGEIWNPITQARFQVYKDQRGMHSVLVYKGKNSFWLPVRTLMQGKQPTKLQTEFLGKDAAWLSPQFIATARDLSSLPAKIEETYRQLDHMSKKELRIAAEKFGIEVPASLVEKEDIALHVESALRARMALDSKEHPLLGVEEGGVIRKLHRMGPLAQNLLSTISSIFTANSEEHIRHAGMLEDQTGRDFEQYGRGVIGKSKEIFGHLYSDLTKFLEALKPSLLGGEGARNVFDLQRIQRVGNAGFYKWSRAVEGRIPLSDLNPAQQRIVQLYIKLSSLIGELAEKGSISGVRLAKSGILSYDSKMVTESVDEKTGETKKKRGGYRPFTSAKGTRAPRWPTSTLFLIMSNRDTVKERMFLAEILAAIPENQDELGESPEKRIKRAFKLLGGERGQQSLSKRDSVEVMRSFKVFPDVMWIGSRKYDLMHGDMYQAAVHMTYGAASRLGFIFQSAKFDDKLGVYRNDKDMVTPQVSKFKTEAGRKRVEKAILALQGKQAYLGHESMPGSVLSAVRAVHGVMLTAFKGLKLPLSVAYNLWETLGLTHALFGSQRYVTALLNLYSLNARETEGILGRLGSLSLLPSKLSLNPSRPVRSVIDLLAAVPLMPVNAANAFNEKLTAETAKQMVIDLRGRVNPNTGRRVRRVLATDRTVLKMFGFTESEIADMLAGTADIELYNEVIRRSVPNTQGTSASIAERPLIPSSRYYRDFIQFTTYFNKEARSHARLIGLAVRGDKQAYKILAKDVGGKLVGGFTAMMMIGLFKGGLEDWREKKKKAETASGIWDLINEMFVSQVMGGPFYTVVRSMFKSPQARVEGEFNLNWLAPISPITSWYADIARAIRGSGTYGGLTMPERMTKLASRSSVLTPGIRNVLYMTGLGAEDYNRDRAYAAYWKWYRKAPGNKQTTLYTQEEQDHKEFRFFTKRAYLKAKELGPLDPEVTSLLLQGAMQGMTLEQFAEDPEGAWDSIAASLSARKLLDIDEDTGIGKLGLKGQEYLRAHLTDEQWSILLAHDELINMMLETTKDMK